MELIASSSPAVAGIAADIPTGPVEQNYRWRFVDGPVRRADGKACTRDRQKRRAAAQDFAHETPLSFSQTGGKTGYDSTHPPPWQVSIGNPRSCCSCAPDRQIHAYPTEMCARGGCFG